MHWHRVSGFISNGVWANSIIYKTINWSIGNVNHYNSVKCDSYWPTAFDLNGSQWLAFLTQIKMWDLFEKVACCEFIEFRLIRALAKMSVIEVWPQTEWLKSNITKCTYSLWMCDPTSQLYKGTLLNHRRCVQRLPPAELQLYAQANQFRRKDKWCPIVLKASHPLFSPLLLNALGKPRKFCIRSNTQKKTEH